MDNYLSGSVGGTRGAMYRDFQGKLNRIGMPSIFLDRFLTASRTLFLAMGCLFLGVLASKYTDHSKMMIMEQREVEMKAEIVALKSRASVGDVITSVNHDRLKDRVEIRKSELRELAKTNEATDSASNF